MGIPLRQQIRVGAYILKQRLLGRDSYPLVLMLEPLFRCNLACAGCGKIDYPDADPEPAPVASQECLDAVDECGAPMVSIPGGEPLLHKEIGEIVTGIVARKKFVYLCTNALLLEKKIDLFKPSPYLTFSIHLDGLREEHDRSVCQARRVRPRGRGDQAAARARLPRQRQRHPVRRRRRRRRSRPSSTTPADELDVEGITVSPGYAYERAPDQAALPQPAQDQAAVPRHLPARPRRAAGGSTTPRSISISSPATRSTAARPGAIRRATSSAGSGPAICSAKATPAPSRS